MKTNKQGTLISVIVAAAMASGCGSGDGDNASNQVRGTFQDSAVEGLEYVAGDGNKQITNAQGEFECTKGQSVSFSIGGISLGKADCGEIITPLTLTGGNNIKNDQVVNRLMALQLLDEDNDPSNGITITTETRAALSGKTLDFTASAPAFNTLLANLLATLPEAYKTRTVDDTRRALAIEHFENTLASKVGTPVAESMSQTNTLGQVDFSVTRYQIQSDDSAYIPYEGSIGGVKKDFPKGFLPSYGSGLAFKGKNANGDMEFYGITDRGPNGDGPEVPPLDGAKESKIFPSPRFAPSIGIITIGKDGAKLGAIMPLKASASTKMSGLTIPTGTTGNSAEVPLLDALKYDASSKATFDVNGLDSESIVVDSKRNVLWVSDEYGPFITKIDSKTGIILNKYSTDNGLPVILKKRRSNRGMEGLALDTTTDKLHGFLQSPLSDGSADYSVSGKKEKIERFARFTRWIEFDPAAGTTAKMYAYPLTGSEYQDGRTGNAKLGDMVALGNGKFLVIEQGAGTSGKVFNKLMLVEIGSATNILDNSFNPTTSDLEKSSMSGTAVNGADWSTVTPLRKTVLLDLNAAGWIAEKAEGLALVDANTIALANDNDFGLKTKIFDANGNAIEGADITKCLVDANGTIQSGSATGCAVGNTARVARGTDAERPARIWLIKFSKPLAGFSAP